MKRNVSPETRAQMSARMSAQMADPAYAAKVAAGRGGIWTPERRERQREVMIAQNADLAFQDKRKIARRQTMPVHTHPVVRGLFFEMNEQRAYIGEVETRAGTGKGTIRDWFHRRMPGTASLDAALNALGLELAIVPAGWRDENGFVKKRVYQRPRATLEAAE